MSEIIRAVLAAAWVLSAQCAAGAAAAQSFPAKPLRLIVPFPGGTTDILARAYAARIGAGLGQPIVVENIAGASGAIGLSRAAKSPPDGLTLTIAATTTFAVSPHLNPNFVYDPLKDFAPVALLARLPILLAAHDTVTAATLKDLLALIRANPGKYNYASISPGSTSHLLGEMLGRATGATIVHVPYKGGAPAMTALIAGEVQILFATIVEATPHIRSGRIKAIALADGGRAAAMPELPTFGESGLAGFETPVWFGLVVPAGTPRAAIDRLAAEVRRANALEEVKHFLAEQGAEAGAMGPDEFAAFMASEYAKFGKLIRDTGIKGG